jgi:hypothetical protein
MASVQGNNKREFTINSIGVRGEVISKRDEVRQVKKIPVNAQEAKEQGYTDEQIKEFKEESTKGNNPPSFPELMYKDAISKIPAELIHCTKLEGVEPVRQPVIVGVDYDLHNGKKNVIYQKERHLYDDLMEKTSGNKVVSRKGYKTTEVVEEKYPESISQHERNCMTKNELINSIQGEVDSIDLSTIKSKEDVLQFANGEGYISNTEKKRRAVLLLNCLCERYRITSRDIASL